MQEVVNYVRAIVQEHFHDIDVPHPRSRHEGREIVFVDGINVRAGFNQLLDASQVTFAGRSYERVFTFSQP